MFKDIRNSVIATGVAEFLTLPICTCKTVYQNSNHNSIKYTVNDIYSRLGIKGFYQASLPAISSQIFSTSSKYVLYRKLESSKVLSDNKFINGAISGVVSSLFTHPLDFIRVHWQMNADFQVKHFDALYRGYSKTFSKVIVGSSLFFPLTDLAKTKTDNIILASLLSGIVSTIVIQPIDYLKTRHIYGLSLYSESPYKGLSLNLLRVVPHFMIVMTCIDFLDKKI